MSLNFGHNFLQISFPSEALGRHTVVKLPSVQLNSLQMLHQPSRKYPFPPAQITNTNIYRICLYSCIVLIIVNTCVCWPLISKGLQSVVDSRSLQFLLNTVCFVVDLHIITHTYCMSWWLTTDATTCNTTTRSL